MAFVDNDSTAQFSRPNETQLVVTPVSGIMATLDGTPYNVILLVFDQVAQVAGGLANPAVAPTAGYDCYYCVVRLREN